MVVLRLVVEIIAEEPGPISPSAEVMAKEMATFPWEDERNFKRIERLVSLAFLRNSGLSLRHHVV